MQAVAKIKISLLIGHLLKLGIKQAAISDGNNRHSHNTQHKSHANNKNPALDGRKWFVSIAKEAPHAAGQIIRRK